MKKIGFYSIALILAMNMAFANLILCMETPATDWLTMWRGHIGQVPNFTVLSSSATAWSVRGTIMGGSRTVSGSTRCSSTNGSFPGVTGNPVTTSGVNCWLQMTIPFTSAWVFFGTIPESGNCATMCSNNAANSLGHVSTTGWSTRVLEPI